MGFFNKKVCDICGGEIGLLGNRKLADGNLCKNCARKLSPWMTDRRESTVEEIRQHLMYRAQNQRVLAGVRPNAVAGADTKVYIDQNARKFFVTNQTNWRDANPDVIDFSQVIDVQTEVTEHRTEETTGTGRAIRCPSTRPGTATATNLRPRSWWIRPGSTASASS